MSSHGSRDRLVGVGATSKGADRNGHIVRWNLETAKPEKMSLSDLTGGIVSISVSPDGRTLAGGCDDGMTRLWDSASGNQLAIFLSGAPVVLDTVFSRDGRKVFSANSSGGLQVWDTEGE